MPKYLPRVCWDSVEQGTEPIGTWAPIKPQVVSAPQWSPEHFEMPHMPVGTFWSPSSEVGDMPGRTLVSFGTCLVGSQGLVWRRGCRDKRLIEGFVLGGGGRGREIWN